MSEEKTEIEKFTDEIQEKCGDGELFGLNNDQAKILMLVSNRETHEFNGLVVSDGESLINMLCNLMAEKPELYKIVKMATAAFELAHNLEGVSAAVPMNFGGPNTEA